MERLLLTFLTMMMLLGFIKNAKACTASKTSCEFYQCQEKKTQCGPDGYFQKIGYDYCKLFQRIDSKLSKRGREWAENTRKCLQEKLIGLDLACDGYETQTVRDHVQCYVEHGYCTLPAGDKLKISGKVMRELFKTPTYILRNLTHMIRKGCL